MKFSTYLQSIDNVSIYPLISLLLFMAVFVGVSIYVFNTDDKTIQEQSNIPLK